MSFTYIWRIHWQMLLMHYRIMLHVFWFLDFSQRNDCMYSEIRFHTQIIFWTIYLSSEKENKPQPWGLHFMFNRHILHKAFTQCSSTSMELMDIQILNKTQQMDMVSETWWRLRRRGSWWQAENRTILTCIYVWETN